MTDKEKIRAEVVRLITDLGEQRDVLLEELLDFIDSLPEEPHQELYNKLSNLRDDAFSNTTKESWEACLSEVPVSEDLEEAAVDYGNRSTFTDVDPFNWILEIAFKDGACWQKQQIIDNACKYLRIHCDEVETEDNGIAGWISDEFIEDFRKYMEG